MYFIVENKEGQLKILRSFEDQIHIMLNLIMYLKEKGITFYETKDKIKEDGTYCIRETDTLYKIVKRVSVPDGYLTYGYDYLLTESELHIVYYQEEKFDFKEVLGNIKVCDHNIKMKKLSKLEQLKTQ